MLCVRTHPSPSILLQLQTPWKVCSVVSWKVDSLKPEGWKKTLPGKGIEKEAHKGTQKRANLSSASPVRSFMLFILVHQYLWICVKITVLADCREIRDLKLPLHGKRTLQIVGVGTYKATELLWGSNALVRHI